MSVLVGLLGAIVAVAGILWRVEMAARATREVAGAVGDARGAVRRWSWRRKFAKDSLAFIDDPREALSALMVAIAASDRPISAQEDAVMMDQLRNRLGVSDRQASELIAHGRWLTRDVTDPANLIRRLRDMLLNNCTPEQLADMIVMVEAVANAEGQPGHIESDAVAYLKRVAARKV